MIETCHYSVQLQQQNVGRYSLQAERREERGWAEATLQWHGAGEAQTISQQSSYDVQTFRSYRFEERNTGHGFSRRYVLEYHHEQGILEARRRLNGEVEGHARIPAMRAYSDPLALLFHLRRMTAKSANDTAASSDTPEDVQLPTTSAPRAPIQVPMLGKDVWINALTSTWQPSHAITGLSEQQCQAPLQTYVLRPGGARVVVSQAYPYAILAMWQPSQEGMLISLLQDYQQGHAPTPRAHNTYKSKRRRRARSRYRR